MQPHVIPSMPVPVSSQSELDLREKTTDYSTAVLATTSIELVPVNKHRTACWIVNKSLVAVSIGLGRDAHIDRGIYLTASGGALEINKTNLFRGQINIIGASGTGNKVTCVELESRYAY